MDSGAACSAGLAITADGESNPAARPAPAPLRNPRLSRTLSLGFTSLEHYLIRESDVLIVTGTGAVGLDIWKSESPAFGRSTGRHTTLGNLLLCRNVTDRQTVSSFSREHSIC